MANIVKLLMLVLAAIMTTSEKDRVTKVSNQGGDINNDTWKVVKVTKMDNNISSWTLKKGVGTQWLDPGDTNKNLPSTAVFKPSENHGILEKSLSATQRDPGDSIANSMKAVVKVLRYLSGGKTWKVIKSVRVDPVYITSCKAAKTEIKLTKAL